MSDLIAAAKEMLAIAQGKQPAARVYVAGSSYVPEADYEDLRARLAEAERERDRYASDAGERAAKLDAAEAEIERLNIESSKHAHDADTVRLQRNAAEAELAKAREALAALLQQVGDSIADAIEQMLKGNWRDDHGHDVRNNVAMIALKNTLNTLMEFRTKHMGYSAALAPAKTEEECTDCGGTGMTYQTERRCSCRAASPEGK